MTAAIAPPTQSGATSERPAPAHRAYRDRFRHVATSVLLDERESRRWEIAEIVSDLERDPASWDYPEQTLHFALTALEDLDAELHRRERLRAHPAAPRWPGRNPRRLDDLKALAEAVKQAWPLDRFIPEMLLTDLAPQGKQLIGRCPLPGHEDRSPSFTVNPAQGVWYCHGCHRGGDLFTLAGHLLGKDLFVDQLMALADAAGLTRPTQEARRGR